MDDSELLLLSIIPVRDAGCKSQIPANSHVAEYQEAGKAVRGNSIGCPVLP